MTSTETIAILDFGSQTSQLIARRVRENHVYSELLPPSISAEELRAKRPSGIILSGGPSSVNDDGAPRCDPAIFELGIPVLGICYGMQLTAVAFGGRVGSSGASEFGRVRLSVIEAEGLFANVPPDTFVWMSHGDTVTDVGDEFISLARTRHGAHAAIRHRSRPIFGVQFHPEVTHTPFGRQLLRNFVCDTCRCSGNWRVGEVIESMVDDVRKQVGDRSRVMCGLSGGVDSGVTAALIHRAIGDRLECVFVDNGLLRNHERTLVETTFRDHFGMHLHVVDARDLFLSQLAGVVDPAEKRTIIGGAFIDAFRDQARSIPDAHFLAQGTTYPDVIESGHGPHGTSATIKAHHNVGALPEELGFELVEPLRTLFKDEVRQLGEALGLPRELVWRHPFPGPGLAVRILGEITDDRLRTLRAADEILITELRATGWYDKVAQGFAVLLPVSTVGVMGDGKTYDGQNIIALRLVESTDFMTADWVHIDAEVLSNISSRIINEVPGVNRVVYDVSSKPPSTIEWE